MRKTILAIAVIAALAGCSQPSEADAFANIRANAQTTDVLSADDGTLRGIMEKMCDSGIPAPARESGMTFWNYVDENVNFQSGSAIEQVDDTVLILGNAVQSRCPELQDEFDNAWGVKFSQVSGEES